MCCRERGVCRRGGVDRDSGLKNSAFRYRETLLLSSTCLPDINTSGYVCYCRQSSDAYLEIWLQIVPDGAEKRVVWRRGGSRSRDTVNFSRRPLADTIPLLPGCEGSASIKPKGQSIENKPINRNLQLCTTHNEPQDHHVYGAPRIPRSNSLDSSTCRVMGYRSAGPSLTSRWRGSHPRTQVL